tara:strand:- start:745 stop:1668 length:924 start_codon:yes stop_codon:yes gene_type:complete
MTFKQEQFKLIDSILEKIGTTESGAIIPRSHVLKCADFFKDNKDKIRFYLFRHISEDKKKTSTDGSGKTDFQFRIQFLKSTLNKCGYDIHVNGKVKKETIDGKRYIVNDYVLRTLENYDTSSLPTDRPLYKLEQQYELTDEEKRISNLLRLKYISIINNNYKIDTYVPLLGCTKNEFRVHLESKFEDGMNWDNYGQRNGCWVVDHILPFSRYKEFEDLSMEDVCLYMNVQPKWAPENNEKSNSIVKEVDEIYHEIKSFKEKNGSYTKTNSISKKTQTTNFLCDYVKYLNKDEAMLFEQVIDILNRKT